MGAYDSAMAKLPAERTSKSDQLLWRVAVGALVVIVVIMVLNMVLGWVFALVRMAVLLAILGVVGWFVLIGPPGMDE
jgi:hypothetical protein